MRNSHSKELALLRRITSAGCPIEQLDPVLLITPLSFNENMIFDLAAQGGTGIMLDVSVTSNASNITICGWDVTVAGCDLSIEWLPDPDELGSSRMYRFLNGLEFERQFVLNHQTGSRGRLTHGTTLEGLLLGQAMQSIPETYRHGASVGVKLSAFDPQGELHTTEIPVWVDRSAKTMHKPTTIRRTGLFGGKTPEQDRRMKERVQQLNVPRGGGGVHGTDDRGGAEARQTWKRPSAFEGQRRKTGTQ